MQNMSRRADSSPVSVTNLHPKIQISRNKISVLTRKVFKLLRLNKELHITFVNDRDIKRMNKLFHGTNTTTDVLAFERPANWPNKTNTNQFLGEVVISVDRAKKYAKRFHADPDEELFRYVVHGLLHLLGERDHQPKLKKKMFRRQETLLQKVGPFDQLMRAR